MPLVIQSPVYEPLMFRPDSALRTALVAQALVARGRSGSAARRLFQGGAYLWLLLNEAVSSGRRAFLRNERAPELIVLGLC